MSALAPTGLRVEHLAEALGIDVSRPRFSWRLPAGAGSQHAYQLCCGAWDSGWIVSEEHLLVPFGGAPLQSRQRTVCKVRVGTDRGVSAWSEPVSLELGLLGSDDWQASWITAGRDPGGEPGHRPALVFEQGFVVDSLAAVARIYASAHGIYELFLDGERVGDLELTPGFTSYRKRTQYQTYDITDRLGRGSHTLRALVSDGWFRGLVGATREHDVYGDELAVLVQLELDGRVHLVTDDTWKVAPSRLVSADLIEGQHTDLTVHDRDLPWAEVGVRDHGFAQLVASPAPPVRRVELIRPRSVTELAPGRHIADLGQNINGWTQLVDLGPAGTKLRLTHGESLDEEGDVTVEHLRPVHFKTHERLSAGQVDTIVSDGSGGSFEPRHSSKGFRYVRIEGHPGPLTPDDVRGVAVHTDLRRTGWFRCSDDRLNRLHEAAVWSFRTNACDIPTDCPQRERAGWTGDWQLFSPTACFLYDVAGFSTKWLRDLAADQRVDGAVRNFAPDPAYPGADSHPVKTFLEGSAGWGDAAVYVPWDVYRFYGDVGLLAEQYDSMRAWVDFQANTARTARHQSRIDRCGEPMPHEEYLWDTGFHWGEWCEPGLTGYNHFDHLDRDLGIVATAYFARSSGVLARIAERLGRPADAARYQHLHAGAVNAWRVEFVRDDGTVRTERQADVVRALAFGLVRPEQRDQATSQLLQMISDAHFHLGTGFLATPFLLPILADVGHADVAYTLLLQRSSPSWLYMIDQGATTIWENWEGLDAGNNGSLNHYSKGAVVSFLHEYTAGIRSIDEAPAYRRFRVAPVPGGDIDWAEAQLDSPHGRIESAWRIVDGQFDLRVVVPPGTSAEVVLPDRSIHDVGSGTALFRSHLSGA